MNDKTQTTSEEYDEICYQAADAAIQETILAIRARDAERRAKEGVVRPLWRKAEARAGIWWRILAGFFGLR